MVAILRTNRFFFARMMLTMSSWAQPAHISSRQAYLPKCVRLLVQILPPSGACWCWPRGSIIRARRVWRFREIAPAGSRRSTHTDWCSGQTGAWTGSASTCSACCPWSVSRWLLLFSFWENQVMFLRTVVRRMLRGRTEGSVQPLRRRRLTSVLATIVWLQVCLLLGLHTPSRFLPHTGIQLWMTPMVEHIVSLRQSASRSGRELALRCKAPDVQLRTTP